MRPKPVPVGRNLRIACRHGIARFVVWLAGADIRRSYDYYDIFFEGSVSGLGIGGDVRYRGIKVGSIVNIAVDPADPERAGVTIEVESTVPIRDGDIAALQLQGITGVAYVNIAGATADSKPLVAGSPAEHPVIPSLPSKFRAVVYRRAGNDR